ncbi:unnamed protein product [Phytomonas sp. EM1]|nr:unnamed protein product [Phytomonas sp. EM1]|eukprot:CCW65660.1 unnamed protein product [Phytomonas sp. isolate EM1]
MSMKRLIKYTKISNKQMLLMKRREPYKPIMKDRQFIENRTRLEDFERKNAEGLMFVPDAALPPWQRSIASNLQRSQSMLNFKGLRVRVVDKQDEPGFPTNFR